MLSLERLRQRAAFFRAIRAFFHEHGFLEVDTPVLLPVLLPESNIIPVQVADHFLQTSPELCMKRLLASGCSRIFQLTPCFRQEERGRLHLREFQMLEWYRREADYLQLMTDCQGLLTDLAQKMLELVVSPLAERLEKLVSATEPWPRVSLAAAFRLFSPVSLDQALANDSFEEMLVLHVEPRLGTELPVFLFDYPASQASLARKKKQKPQLAERFELYWQGVELANGFSELADSAEQRQRFEQEIAAIAIREKREAMMPHKFLADLPAMGEAAGIALGVDRLLMLFLGEREIERVLPFTPDDLA